MRMGRVRVIGVMGALVASCLGGPAAAQPGTELLRKHLPPTKFETQDFDELALRAEREFRLLVIYIREPKDPATPVMDRRVWNNPTLAAQIRWHALAYKFDFNHNPGLAATLGIQRRDCPAVVVARASMGNPQVLDRMVTLRNPLMPAATSHGLDPTGGDIPDIYPGTIKVIQNIDTELEALRARDPSWASMHDQLNPEPQPPPDPDPLFETTDSDAPAVSDPEPLTGTPDVAGLIDVYEQLDAARGAVADGDLYLATGLYTWLWERADKVDPSFRSAKRSVVAEEMRQLAAMRRSARARFLRLREYYDERLLWTTYERLGDWLLLNGVVGDKQETVGYLDLFVNDLDEGSMLPDCDKIAYRLLVTRGYWNDGWDLGERPAPPATQLGSETLHKPVSIPVTTRAAQLVRADAGGRGMGLSASERAKLSEFRKIFAVDECARLHAACLRVGRDVDAWRIADTLIGARPEPEARLALVATALAAGQVRPRHAQLLEEARGAGAFAPVLKRRVEKALSELARDPALAPRR